MKIIALAGRKGSGKSTISNYLVQNENFKKISFADYLKELIADVFLIDKKYLHDQSLKELKCLSIHTDLDFYKKISDYIKDDVTYLFRQVFILETPRQLLQFVGTDVLRAHDTNFHVKKTLLKIKNSPNVNFVCDDLRFKNELIGLKSVNVEDYFVIRPNNWNISNHASEIDIHLNDITNKIINNININLLIHSFKNRYLDNNKFSEVIVKDIQNFNYNSPNHENLSFIGGFLCEHKIKNNLKLLEIDSIKVYLSEIISNINILSNVLFLENIKYWLDPLYPPSNPSSWQRGRNYYNFIITQ